MPIRTHVKWSFAMLITLLIAAVGVAAEQDSPAVVGDEYSAAYKRALAAHKMLIVVFQQPGNPAAVAFEERVLQKPDIAKKMQSFEVVKVPLQYEISVGGKKIQLLRHAAFGEMLGRQGVAIVDLTDPKGGHHGDVVSVYPFRRGRYMHPAHFAKMLSLPSGTLTQRTLIFAVRIHPEHPASADSKLSLYLASETESHSRNQANMGLQGHHNWESRFHRINARLSGGLTSTEVCAESWPGQSLVDAAIECVNSWRQSPGHWSAVRRRHSVFGYDMKRGRNGIWYGTGIFGRR